MKGIALQLFDGTTPRANLTNIQALWWDVLEPKDAMRPIGKSDVVTTDANGYVHLDLSSITGKALGEFGLLTLYQLDSVNHEDSLVFTGRVAVSDIVAGVDMYYYDSGWERPADWPAIDPPEPGTQKFQGLWAVFDTPDQYIALSAAGAYTVDWGDGVVEDVASGATATHLYLFSDPALSAVTSKGYKCAVVTVTPQSGQNLTTLDVAIQPGVYSQPITSGWLDMSINGSLLASLTLSGTNVRPRRLEQCWIGEHGLASLFRLFNVCSSLQSVPLFDTAGVTSMFQMFTTCSSLQSVPPFDVSGSTALHNMFNTTNLRRSQILGAKVTHGYANCSLSAVALNEIYTNLADVTAEPQTITVTGNYGTSQPAHDPTIATAKGWTVTQ